MQRAHLYAHLQLPAAVIELLSFISQVSEPAQSENISNARECPARFCQLSVRHLNVQPLILCRAGCSKNCQIFCTSGILFHLIVRARHVHIPKDLPGIELLLDLCGIIITINNTALCYAAAV
jgi:hypothetical protein